MSLELLVHPDQVWPDRVAADLHDYLTGNPGARVCLATGRTTRPVYQQTVIRAGVELLLLDEFGGLAPDDPARCAAMLRQDLPGVAFDSPDVDSPDPVAAAAAYGNRISRNGLDLCVVGLGVNGHVGMNEPGSASVQRTRVVDLAEETAAGAIGYGASARPSWGITVGIAELMEAREIWLVVTGEHKASVLAAALNGEIGPHLPASFLRDHVNMRVLADETAAGGL